MSDIVKDFIDVLDQNNWNRLKKYDDYHKGIFEKAGLPSTNQTALAQEYTDLLSRADLPLCSLVVSAVVDRLQIIGFRTNGGSPDNAFTDPVLWDWFQSSSMDARQYMLYTDAMVFGDGLLSVTPDGEIPKYRIESPLQTSFVIDSADPTKIEIAAKVAGKMGWLYTDEVIVSFRKSSEAHRGWQVTGVVEHNAGGTPMVRFSNRPDSRGRSLSEISLIAAPQRRIIQTVADRLIIQRAAAWKQRYVSGISIEQDADGNAIPPFKVGIDQLAVSENPDTKFGEWAASSFKEHLDAIDADIKHIAAITQTPPHLLSPNSISNISAEALVALEAGLSAKVASNQQNHGESWEYALRLGGNMVGYDVPEDTETLWQDLERRSDAQKVDGALKLRSMGLPMPFILERLGLSPLTIERVMEQIEKEQAQVAASSAAAFGMSPLDGNGQDVVDQMNQQSKDMTGSGNAVV